MKNLIRYAGVLAFALALSSCAPFGDLLRGDLPGAAASVGDTLVTPAIHAPVANTALAAETLYSGTQEVLTADLKNHVITPMQGRSLDPILDKVYAAVVALRPIQHGGDATALLKAFNVAFGDLFTAAKRVGVTLPTTIDPATN